MTGGDPREETMMRYLLGKLPNEEQDRLEREFLQDDGTFEQLLALEDELRYEYAQGGLDPETRRLFEERHLRSPEGQRRLEQARALLGRVRKRSRQWAPMRQTLAAAAVLVLASGAAWLSFLAPQQGTHQASREPSRPAAGPLSPAAGAAPGAVPPSGASASRLVAGVFSLALAPGLVRDTGEVKRISLPPGAAILRLILDLPKTSAYTRYLAVLRSAEGGEAWTGAAVRPTRPAAAGTLALEVPAERLKEGDYEVTLSGQTAAGPEEIGDYYFRVLRD